MEGRLRGDAVPTHPRSCSHTGREGRAWFTLQIDAKAVGVLGVLQQEPGSGKGLLTGGAGITAGLIFICKRSQRGLLNKSSMILIHVPKENPRFVT